MLVRQTAVTLLLAALVSATSADQKRVTGRNHTFGLAADGSCLLQDDTPTRLISGCFHYYRAPAAEWEQRLDVFAAAGFDTLQTYVAWNFHCPDEPGACDFSGDRNITRFLELAHARGLRVVLRPGPYICAEWEFGGFPAWLLRNDSNAPIRTRDPTFMAHVGDWFDILMPRLEPYLFAPHGGPIVMVQLENEYGTFGSDKAYLEELRTAIVSRLGSGVLIFSTDSDDPQHVRNSAIPGVFQVVDFFYWGTPRWAMNITAAWEAQRAGLDVTRTPGPHYNAEFYPGWYGSWTDRQGLPWHGDGYVEWVLDSVLLANRNASLNFYMGFGGTNFGLWSALPVITSYDYNAPVNESGHPGRLFHGVRDTLALARSTPPPPLPTLSPLRGLGRVHLERAAPLADVLGDLALGALVAIDSSVPLAMERVNQSFGMTAYTPRWGASVTAFSSATTCTLLLNDQPRDYVMVFDGTHYLGHLIRDVNQSIEVPTAAVTRDAITLIVENMGRAKGWHEADGPGATAAKGLVVAPSIVCNGTVVQPVAYRVSRLPMAAAQVQSVTSKMNASSAAGLRSMSGPMVLRGELSISAGTDLGSGTLFQVRGLRKGSVYVNGHNLGRYWLSVGSPQSSLYCPASFLVSGMDNNVTVVEEEPGPLPYSDETQLPFLDTGSDNANRWLAEPPL